MSTTNESLFVRHSSIKNCANEQIRIGFIGAGNMAYALCAGLINSGYVKPNQISASAPSNNNICKFKELGCIVTHDNSKIFQESNLSTENSRSNTKLTFILFTCVKPHIPLKLPGFWDFLTKQNFINSIASTSLIIISPLAGVPLSMLKVSIDSHFKNDIPYRMHLARIMPNTACSVNAGAIGLALHESAYSVSEEIVILLRQLGYCQLVNEDQLDAVVGVAGSGIAFVYSMIQAMADGGVLVGLPRQTALKFAAQTVAGAAEMVLKTGEGPIELRNNVCSPAGTTINGLVCLEKGAFNSTVMSAIEAATNKSREYSKLSSPNNK